MASRRSERARGASLSLASSADTETLVRARGTTFIVTDRNGNVAPPGARELGLFRDDTRYLSHYELTLTGGTFVHLSSKEHDPACNRVDLMVSGLGDGEELLEDPQNFLHVRRRQLIEEEFHEQIEIVNYLQRNVHVQMVLAFAADFADVFEIRGARRAARGEPTPPIAGRDAIELGYKGLDGRVYRTVLTFAPTPDALNDDRAVFDLSLEPGQWTTLDVAVTGFASDAPPRRRGAFRFDASLRRAREESARFADECTRFRCDDVILQHVLEQATRDVRSLSIGFAGHEVLAAGIPWFCCPFGRDSLIASYEALTLDPRLAMSSVRALAAFQGTKFDDYTEEEPGKIFHELRTGEMARSGEIPHSPYYGTIDATPLFVVVAHAAYLITADREFLEAVSSPLRAALAWIDRRSDEGTNLVTYQRKHPKGLENQGWKDSRAGVSFPDGRRAQPPIALSEVQGYCVDAYRRGAAILAVLGDEVAARTYRERAETMRELVERTLWMDEAGRYAFAVDGRGARLPTIVSNVGHLLWSRVPSPERARLTTEVLLLPESFSPFGVRTLAAGQPVFNPLSYHNGTVWPHDNALLATGFANYGFMDEACLIFESLVSAMEQLPERRLPELYCGTTRSDHDLIRYPVACSPQAWATAAPFLLLQAVLGLELDGPRRRLLIRSPKMPQSVGRLEVDGLRVGASRISLRVRRVGKRCHIDRLDVSGPSLKTLVELD